MLETTLQCFRHDLVVTIIFALSLERLSPSVAILQVAQLHNCHGAFGDLDAVSVRHWEGILFYRATLSTAATASAMSF
jgi:hypothetical protein